MWKFDEDDAWRTAQEVRMKYVRNPESYRDAYVACYFVAKKLKSRVPDVVIMTGDVDAKLHHWLASRAKGIFIDPSNPGGTSAAVGKIDSPEYTQRYRGQPGNINLEEPRNHPKYLFAPDTWDSLYTEEL